MEADTKTVVEVDVCDGDVLTMEGLMQKHCLHLVPKANPREPVRDERINITFRWIRQHRYYCPLYAQGRRRKAALPRALRGIFGDVQPRELADKDDTDKCSTKIPHLGPPYVYSWSREMLPGILADPDCMQWRPCDNCQHVCYEEGRPCYEGQGEWEGRFFCRRCWAKWEPDSILEAPPHGPLMPPAVQLQLFHGACLPLWQPSASWWPVATQLLAEVLGRPGREDNGGICHNNAFATMPCLGMPGVPEKEDDGSMCHNSGFSTMPCVGMPGMDPYLPPWFFSGAFNTLEEVGVADPATALVESQDLAAPSVVSVFRSDEAWENFPGAEVSCTKSPFGGDALEGSLATRAGGSTEDEARGSFAEVEPPFLQEYQAEKDRPLATSVAALFALADQKPEEKPRAVRRWNRRGREPLPVDEGRAVGGQHGEEKPLIAPVAALFERARCGPEADVSLPPRAWLHASGGAQRAAVQFQ